MRREVWTLKASNVCLTAPRRERSERHPHLEFVHPLDDGYPAAMSWSTAPVQSPAAAAADYVREFERSSAWFIARHIRNCAAAHTAHISRTMHSLSWQHAAAAVRLFRRLRGCGVIGLAVAALLSHTHQHASIHNNKQTALPLLTLLHCSCNHPIPSYPILSSSTSAPYLSSITDTTPRLTPHDSHRHIRLEHLASQLSSCALVVGLAGIGKLIVKPPQSNLLQPSPNQHL